MYVDTFGLHIRTHTQTDIINTILWHGSGGAASCRFTKAEKFRKMLTQLKQQIFQQQL